MYTDNSVSRKEAGFTIVELLIVIVIIAILATITIIGYNGIRANAINSSLTSDGATAAIILANDQTTNGIYPATAAAANGGKGLPMSNGNTYVYTPNNSTFPPSYTLTISNPSSPNSYVMTNSNPTPTLVSSSIAAAAGSSPLAVLTGGSGSTGIADGALSAGYSVYTLVDATSYSQYFFTMGGGTGYTSMSVNGVPYSSRNNANILNASFGPNQPQNEPLPTFGPTVFAFIQSPSNRYVRVPGVLQVSNTDGYSMTSSPSYTNSFARVWIFAGVHSQATSDAVMNAIDKDSSVGANGRPMTLGITPIYVDTAYGSPFPVTFTTGIGYGNPTPSIQWQRSTNGTTFVDVPGANSTTYVVVSSDYPTYSYFRAKLTNAQGTSFTFPANITDSGGGG